MFQDVPPIGPTTLTREIGVVLFFWWGLGLASFNFLDGASSFASEHKHGKVLFETTRFQRPKKSFPSFGRVGRSTIFEKVLAT